MRRPGCPDRRARDHAGGGNRGPRGMSGAKCAWLRGPSKREEGRDLAVEALVAGELRRDVRAVVVGDGQPRHEDLVLAEAAHREAICETVAVVVMTRRSPGWTG